MTSKLPKMTSCFFCNGSGKCYSTDNLDQAGNPLYDVCSMCGGLGNVSFSDAFGDLSDVVLKVDREKGKFKQARLRCRTWRIYTDKHGTTGRQWGKDKWQIVIKNRQDALTIWRLATSYKIKRSFSD